MLSKTHTLHFIILGRKRWRLSNIVHDPNSWFVWLVPSPGEPTPWSNIDKNNPHKQAEEPGYQPDSGKGDSLQNKSPSFRYRFSIPCWVLREAVLTSIPVTMVSIFTDLQFQSVYHLDTSDVVFNWLIPPSVKIFQRLSHHYLDNKLLPCLQDPVALSPVSIL